MDVRFFEIKPKNPFDFQSLSGKPGHRPISLEKFGPNELNLLEPALLEVRTGSELKLTSESLKRIDSTKEFDKLLDEYKYVFILFWTSSELFLSRDLDQKVYKRNIYQFPPFIN